MVSLGWRAVAAHGADGLVQTLTRDEEMIRNHGFAVVRPRRVTCSVLAFSTVMVALLSPAAMAQPAPSSLPGVPTWTLSPSPILRIGDDTDPNATFLRIKDVTRMPTGDILVPNDGTAELRVFSPRGAFIRSLSRQGQGPGELGYLGRVYRSGDTLFVTEFAPRSPPLHVFTLRDGFRNRSVISPSNAPKGASIVGRLSGGEFLVMTGAVIMHPVAGVLSRDTMPVGILRGGPSGTVEWLGSFPNVSWLGYASPTLRVGVGMVRYTLGPSLVTGVSQDRIWIGDSGTGEIAIHDAKGTVVARAEWPMRSRAFSSASLDRARKRALAAATGPEDRARYEALYTPEYRPRRAPLFTRFIPASDGQMGVELFEEEDRAVPRSILILDRNGIPRGQLVCPAGVTLHEIGVDYALGVETDTDDVERVVMYRLSR